MGGVDIIYLASKAHTYRPKLLKPEDWTLLLSAKTLQDFVNRLYTTAYREYLLGSGSLSKTDILKIIKNVFRKRIQMFVSQLPSKYQSFMKSYISRLEVPGIIGILSEKIANKQHSQPQKYSATGLDLIPFYALIKARSVEMAINSLPIPIFDAGVRLALDLWKRYKKLYVVELALYKGLFSNALKYLEEIPDDERDVVKMMLGIEIDIHNLLVTLGPMLYGYSPELIDALLVPYSYKLSTSLLRTIYSSDPHILTRVVPPLYRELVSYYINKQDPLARARLYKILSERAIQLILRDTIGFGYVFAIIKLFEIEYDNLRTIIEGISQGLPTEKISQLIAF